MEDRVCRFCGGSSLHSFIDLGMSPLSNAYIQKENLFAKENFYPLNVFVCETCFLAQLEEFETPEQIFEEYAYFSSYSDSWLQHAKKYVDVITERFQLTSEQLVVEIASNDGYLLQYFLQKEISVLGIEPAANVVAVAEEKGVPSIVRFFGKKLATELVAQGKQADLLLGNNVLAHVPDINDFVSGLKFLLKPTGIITMEFPHLLKLMDGNQFDTIYHEHFSYLSLITVQKIFEAHGLELFDVEELETHGGSLRIYAKHVGDIDREIADRVQSLIRKEKEYGLNQVSTYEVFGEKVKKVKRDLLAFLIKAKNEGKTIVGYGAPAKGNTLLNYCGIREDFLNYTVDRSPYKQGLYLPGTHIAIKTPEEILKTKPDYVLILPWNIKNEIMEQMSLIREWDGKFIIPIPEVMVV